MQAFEWEQREDDTPLFVHMIAGSLAGISQHLSMIPIDNVKTHCQAGQSLTVMEIITKIYRAGGLTNFYAGSSIIVAGCAPAHAIYFSIYEEAKIWLKCKPEEDVGKFAFVGALSAMFHDLIMTPAEALKQRLQLMRSENAKISLWKVAGSVYKNQGMKAYYRSFPVNYAMNIPFGSLIIVFNQKLKHMFGVKDGDHSLNYYICGATAGGIASIPTTPLDVIKTKLNTQYCSTKNCQKSAVCNVLRDKIDKVIQPGYEQIPFKSKRGKFWMQNKGRMSTVRQEHIKYRNIRDTAVKIWKEEGFGGFFKGLQMRVMIQSVSSGVAWGTYQIIKNALGKHTH